MQHASTLELAKRAVRAQICPRCYQRPAGSESLDLNVRRSCEAQCTLFMHLPHLTGIVQQRDAMLSSTERTVRDFICQKCGATPTAGDFCSEYLSRTCPLSRYGLGLIELLERLRDRHVK